MLKEEETEKNPAAGAGPAEAESSEVQKLIEERDAARKEKAELLEKFQRAQAEFENTRKRMQREREETREYAAMETIEALLPVVDDFERALSAEGIDPEFRKGLELIHNRIVEVFKRMGLTPIQECGEFDPELHQAVDRAPAESDEDDQKILEVYRAGYKFKDRLLRAAMVKVAVKE
ncbi:MAG: nucleotide exchange factor GrpE [Bryobacterales bacterium]